MTSPIRVNPVRRNLKFDFDYSRLNDWHYNGRNITHFMNTLSIFFPEGEQFFIDSVRYYRDKGVIKDEELLKDIRAFIGQEAMHSREHEELNEEMERQGLGVAAKDKTVGKLLKFVQRVTPPSLQLSATCALEHMTATLADSVLQWDNVFAEGDNKSDTVYTDAWNWHALEETEHKGVAYDVYQIAVGKDSNPSAYLQRVAGHVVAHAVFWPITIAYWVDVSRRAGDLTNVKDWLKAADSLVGRKPGVLRRKLPAFFTYFRPGFHPWDDDNREFLHLVDAIAERYAPPVKKAA